jgi:hypothetical protein
MDRVSQEARIAALESLRTTGAANIVAANSFAVALVVHSSALETTQSLSARFWGRLRSFENILHCRGLTIRWSAIAAYGYSYLIWHWSR